MSENATAQADTAQDSAQTNDFADFEKSRNAGEPAEQQEKPVAASAKAGAAEDAGEVTDSPDGTQEPTDKKGIRERFKHFSTKAAADGARIRDLEQQLAAKAEPVKPATEAATPPTGKPVVEKFETYEAYIEALTDWKVDEKDRVNAAKAETAKAEQSAKTRFNTFVERAVETRKVHADYDAVTAQELPVSQAMHEVLLDSEHGPELAYYLGSNPEECARIAQLSPLAAAKAMGVIEYGFAKEAPETAPKPKVSTAPKPPSTVGGRTSSTKTVEDPDLDYTAFERLRNAAARA